MSTINIAGLSPVDDPSYRYKMPRILVKVEGRGNGIKTVLVNVVELGSSLNREPGEITKFFGCELGSQTTYANDTDRAIVNGAHRDTDLQTHLSKYIENFVLCADCHLPETHYKIKDGLISQKCLACGAKSPVDMRHRLTAYILAQHKKAKAEAKSSGADKKKDKKEKKKDKKEKSADHAEDGQEGDNDEGSTEKKKSSSDKKSKKKSSSTAAPKTTALSASATGENAVGENVFGINDALNDAANEEEGDDDDEESDSKAAEDGMNRLKLFISHSIESNGSPPTTSEIVDELRNIQTMASLRPADRIIIYLGAVFTENITENNEIDANVEVLRALAPTPIQQRHLIAAVEWFCGTRYPGKLLKYFPVVLKKLFDLELVEEDVFLQWSTDLDRNEYSAEQSMIELDVLEQLKANAAPFIIWLEEAEEEDDDDEEDEDEEEEGDEEKSD